LGLDYDQALFGGELQAWMQKCHGYLYGNTFCKGSFLEVKFFVRPHPLEQETWPPENSNFIKILLAITNLIGWTPHMSLSLPCSTFMIVAELLLYKTYNILLLYM